MLKLLWAGPWLVACGGEPEPPARTHTVEIREMAFHPGEIHVQPGNTVVWVNRDLVPHTATAADSAWTSPSLGPDERWPMVVGGSGTGTYICAFHPVMEARLVIDPPHSADEVTP